MIPAEFDYHAPTSVEAAQHLLASSNDAKALAGGQSLMPLLRMRLATPELIVDLSKIDELRGIRDAGDAIVIGAMTPHATVMTDPLVAEHAALLAKAATLIGDPQVRHVGTFGGSMAHADPASDLPACAMAMGAEFEIAGSEGRRSVAAADFFQDIFTTAIGDDEILTEVRIPKHTGWGAHYEKFVRTAQQWPIVAVAATVRVVGGSIAEAHVALANMGSTPIRSQAVEQALVGVAPEDGAVRAAVADIAAGTNPPTDINGDDAYRRHLAPILARRAVLAAAG
ncbi:MAG TPA: xanthine dehydrogenase family protein subunit M [Nocardioidaceae bacterium]|nr:xanthine dehydrogenase family protein subunit M [Nocardioidaceae bacterium]